MAIITPKDQLPPHDECWKDFKRVFLAGSIEMGKAEDWQASLINSVNHRYALMMNPRRDDWDSSWEQSIDCEAFKHQVNWELDALDTADLIVFYFDPYTISPITLLEFGRMSESYKNILVCCPRDYFRRGNIEIVCHRQKIPLVEKFEDMVSWLNAHLWR